MRGFKTPLHSFLLISRFTFFCVEILVFDPDFECINYNLTEDDNIIDFLSFTDNMNKTIYINKRHVHCLLLTNLQFIDTIKPYNIEKQFFMV